MKILQQNSVDSISPQRVQKQYTNYLTESRDSHKTTRLFDFEILKKVGEGAYSDVFKVKRKSDG